MSASLEFHLARVTVSCMCMYIYVCVCWWNDKLTLGDDESEGRKVQTSDMEEDIILTVCRSLRQAGHGRPSRQQTS